MEAAGVAMGEMEIIKLNTGEKTTYAIDGTIIKEQIQSKSIGATNAKSGNRLILVDTMALKVLT
jgi:aspartate 1-decarboxylase